MKFLTPTFVKQSKPCLSADDWECWGPAEGPQLWKVKRAFHLSCESSWACSDQWDRDAVGDNYWGEYSTLGWAFTFTLLQDLHGKEKEMLVNESKEKIATRTKALDRAKEVKAQLKI